MLQFVHYIMCFIDLLLEERFPWISLLCDTF